MATTEKITSPKLPTAAKLAMQFQAFLLRRGWMGRAGDMLMVITTTGRKTGKRVSTPIGYVSDGEHFVALTRGGSVQSNWYRNLRANPQATLEVTGQPITVNVEFLDTPEQRQYAIRLFREQRADNFKSFFGVEVSAPPAELEAAFAARVFVRFYHS